MAFEEGGMALWCSAHSALRHKMANIITVIPVMI